MDNKKTTNHLANINFLAAILLAFIALTTAVSSHAQNDHHFTYRVQRGDTLGTIAAQYLENYADWRTVSQLNKLKNPNRIEPNSILRIPRKLLKQSPMAATIAFAAGNVALRNANAVANHPIKQGATVNEGDQIVTDQTGTATVDFLDGSQLVILRNSVVSFNQLKGRSDTGVTSIQIEIKQGRVETRVAPRKHDSSRYEIITPTVQIGVRGTQFRVKLDETGELTRTEVLQGAVAAENAFGSESVGRGYGTIIEKNQAPRPPVALLPAPIAPTFLMTPNETILHWPPLANAIGYRVVIATDAGFANRLAEYATNKPQIQLAPLATGRYFIRVLGVDSMGLEGNAGERSMDL